MPELATILRSSIFSSLEARDPNSFDWLVRSGQWHTFDTSPTLWKRGDRDTVALVAVGYVKILRDGVAVDTVGKGHALGLSALWGRPHGATVELAERAACILWNLKEGKTSEALLSSGTLLELLKENQRLVHHLNRLQVLQLGKGKTRLSALVAQHLLYIASKGVYSDAQYTEIELSHDDLGELVGRDKRSVQTALKPLIKRSAIKKSRGKIVILDAARLEEFITEWVEAAKPPPSKSL